MPEENSPANLNESQAVKSQRTGKSSSGKEAFRYAQQAARAAREAAKAVAALSTAEKDAALAAISEELQRSGEEILAGNALDMAAGEAAGLGTRMTPLTQDKPKPLIEVLGKPLIDHVIDRLVQGGVNFIVVNVHRCKANLRSVALLRRKQIDADPSVSLDV